jgi:hypothetical protein
MVVAERSLPNHCHPEFISGSTYPFAVENVAGVDAAVRLVPNRSAYVQGSWLVNAAGGRKILK